MNKILFSVLMTLSFLPLLTNAQNNNDKIPVDAKIKSGVLANGLKYYIIQNKKPEKKIELRIAVNAGYILDDNNHLGLAKLLVHINVNG